MSSHYLDTIDRTVTEETNKIFDLHDKSYTIMQCNKWY